MVYTKEEIEMKRRVHMETLMMILDWWSLFLGGGIVAVVVGYLMIIVGSFRMLDARWGWIAMGLGIPVEMVGAISFNVGVALGIARLIAWFMGF